MKVALIPNTEVARVWSEVEPHLKRAVARSRGRFEIVDLLEHCVTGVQQLWIVMDDRTENLDIVASFTTEFLNYPRVRALNCVFCGGYQISAWKDVVSATLRQFARDNECGIVELTGRPGWRSVLESVGWSREFTTYTMGIEDG